MTSRRTWLSITVELIEGRGEHLWPRPGRIFAAGKHHTFERFATAIDDAFARWDRSHLHEFHLYPPDADYRTRPQRIARPDLDWDDDSAMSIAKTKLSILSPGQQFLYVFDLGDDWTHLCTVADKLIDPLETLGITTSEMPGPLPYWGWGSIPDQYGRQTCEPTNDEEDAIPDDPYCHDLPPWMPHWGPDHQYPHRT